MSSSDEVPHSVDPEYAALFRESSPADVAPPDSGHAEAPAAGAPAAPPRPSSEPIADTGRLFRSQGVKDNDSAVLALTSVQSMRLRSLKRTVVEPSPVTAKASAPAVEAGAASPDADPYPPVVPAEESARRGRRAASSPGLPARMCYLLIIGVTLIVAFINALLAKGDIGWPTGLAMLIVTVYCALKVRREDDLVPVITPPIAFFLTAITAAQLFLGSAERSLLNRGVVLFFTLADNWMWIIGTTLVALVIMIVRRRRS